MNTKTENQFIVDNPAFRLLKMISLLGLLMIGLAMGGASTARAQAAQCNADINCLGGQCVEGSCTCPANGNCTWYRCTTGFTMATVTRLGTTVARCTRQVRFGIAVCKPGTRNQNYRARRGLDMCFDASGQRSFPAFCVKGKLFIDAEGLQDNCADTLVRPPDRVTLTIE